MLSLELSQLLFDAGVADANQGDEDDRADACWEVQGGHSEDETDCDLFALVIGSAGVSACRALVIALVVVEEFVQLADCAIGDGAFTALAGALTAGEIAVAVGDFNSAWKADIALAEAGAELADYFTVDAPIL